MRLKKLWTAIWTFFVGVLFCACAELPFGDVGKNTEKVSFTVEYCYHMPQTGNAMTLWNGCYPFLSADEVGTDKLIAGDVLEVEYTGVMFVLESFPGQVRTDDFTLKKVTIKRARVAQVTYVLEEGNGKILDGTASYPASEYVLTSENGAYTETGGLQSQMQIYASFHAETGELSALYTFNPAQR